MTSAPANSSYADSIAMALIAAGRLAQQLVEAELAATGLTMRHFGALAHVARNPDMSISDLARRSNVTAQSMHATVRGLEERGALLSHDQGRGRPAKMTVTDVGHRMLDQMRAATADLDRQLATLLGDDAGAVGRIVAALKDAHRIGASR